MKTHRLITTKSVIAITFVVFLTVSLLDYFFNLRNYHTLYQNLLFILIFFTLFLIGAMTLGLYYGIKLQDNIGKLTDNINLNKLPDMNGASFPDGDFGEGLIALLSAIVMILFAYVFIMLSWYFLILFSAMLYWIYFRALRLVFKHSVKCKNNWRESLKIALLYSFSYTFWLYLVILGIHIISPTF